MKNIYLYVTPFFPTPTSWRGGYCFDMVRALQKTGKYDIRVLRPGNDGDYEYNGIKVTTFPVRELPFGLAPFLTAVPNRRSFLKALRRAKVNADDVAVVHLHGNVSSYLASAVKSFAPSCRVLLHHHCTNPVRFASGRLGEIPIHANILKWFYARMFKSVDIQVFCSESSRRSCCLPIKRSTIYYNGYDPEVFKPDERSRAEKGRFTIGCIGNFQPLKDQATLIRAVSRIKDKIRVIFVGSGETLGACQQLVKKLKLEETVEFRKEVDHLALPGFYRSLDLFVLPSRLEGFSCVYMEAAGCGVPIIGCKGVSVQEALSEEEQERCLFTMGDDKELSEKILAFMREPGKRVPKFVRDFTTTALAERFLKEIEG